MDLQIQVFQDRQDADDAELSKRFDYTQPIGGKQLTEIDEADGVFGVLNGAMKNTKAYTHFTELLKQGLLIPQNPTKQSKYWMILETLCKQIVIQKDGEDPDPDYSKIGIDREQLMQDMIGSEKVREAEDRAKKMSERAQKATKELEQ